MFTGLRLKIFLISMAAVAIISGLWYIKYRIYQEGYDSCRSEYESKLIAANNQIKAAKQKIRHETQSMDRGAIVAELCRYGWVRSPENCHY